MSWRPIRRCVALLVVLGFGGCGADETGAIHLWTEPPEPTSCQDDRACRPPEAHCSPTLAVCVECLEELHCGDRNRPACDAEVGQCVECLADHHCGGAHPYCQLELRRCVACLLPEHCDKAPETCDSVDWRCAPSCATDADCSGGRASCHPTRLVCVECLEDEDCTDPKKPVCRLEENVCKAP